MADLHNAGFYGGLLPFTSVLNGEERRGRETHCQYEEREREREAREGGMEESSKRDRDMKRWEVEVDQYGQIQIFSN